MAETQCIIPISTLMAAPFSLQIGSSVYVSVLCYNEIGNSPDSDVGNGAIIRISTVPDAPLNLARSSSEDFDQTKLSLVWSDGLHDGNQVVLDYRVLIQDPVTFEWTTFADNVMTRSYTAQSLVSGQSYTFAIQSRNTVGMSTSSTALTLTACEEPSTPATPMTEINEVANTIKITWQEPSSNGTPLTAY